MTHVLRLFQIKNGQVEPRHFAQFSIRPEQLDAVLAYQSRVFWDVTFTHTLEPL